MSIGLKYIFLSHLRKYYVSIKDLEIFGQILLFTKALIHVHKYMFLQKHGNILRSWHLVSSTTYTVGTLLLKLIKIVIPPK